MAINNKSKGKNSSKLNIKKKGKSNKNSKSKSKANSKAKKNTTSKSGIKRGTQSKKKQAASLRTSYKNGEVFVCTWDVWISGTMLDDDKKAYINSIQVKETVDGSDVATIVVQDPDFLFLEDNIFVEDNKIKISMGWANYVHRCTFNGYITHVDISFPEDGIPKLTLTCMDNTFLMDREEKSRSFKSTTSAAVVKKICKEYGYKCVVEKGYAFPKQDTITQTNQTDIAFIQDLAQKEVTPFTARLVGSTFYYQKKGTLKEKAKMELTYREYPYDIISFDPKINKTSKDSVEQGSTDTSSKKAGTTKVKDKSNGKASTNSGKNKPNSKTAKTAKYDKVNRGWK